MLCELGHIMLAAWWSKTREAPPFLAPLNWQVTYRLVGSSSSDNIGLYTNQAALLILIRASFAGFPNTLD